MSAEDILLDRVDAISQVLTDTPQTPSAIARKAKLSTTATIQPLAWMVEHQYCIAVGNGAWRRYRTRRFGEVRKSEPTTTTGDTSS